MRISVKELSVYIHIPFCIRKCNYCDFLSAPATAEKRNQYIDALKREMISEAFKYEEYCVKTVFFGGGTPSILESNDVEALLEILKSRYNFDEQAEITLEMNPATASKEKMQQLFAAGVNRLSIGLQSAQDDELKMLGRVHCYADFLETYQLAREVGFNNINIDLMSGLPGQNLEKWEDTLQKVILLKPEHISAYSLIIEEGTDIYKNLEKYPALPAEDEEREMYRKTKEILKENGFERYEISNYAKKGFECRHNCVYWERKNYVGFGVGAASMVEDRRWKNTDDMEKYLSCDATYLKEDKEELNMKECMEEFMFLGLRMMKGVSKQSFTDKFKISIDEIYGDVLAKWEKQKCIRIEADKVHLTELGIDISNQIFTDFLQD